MNTAHQTKQKSVRGTFVRRFAVTPFKLLARVALRLAVTSVVFLVCAAVTLRLLGYELPLPSHFEEYFDGVERLADILS